MSTPEESLDVALDDSRDRKAREDAIDQLEAANDCDKLADVARTDGLADDIRRQAVEALSEPQCEGLLATLVDEGSLPESLQGRAEELLSDSDESGPRMS